MPIDHTRSLLLLLFLTTALNTSDATTQLHQNNRTTLNNLTTSSNDGGTIGSGSSSSIAVCSGDQLNHCVFVAVLLGALIICSIIGNSFVIAAIYLERSLQNVANYLIVSLACADLMVAITVMPFAAYQEISNKWFLGPILCDIWTSFDVLCCTASILHLVAIALDRYWAITDSSYGVKRTAKRIVFMIVIIWVTSTIMGVAPHLFGLGSLKNTDMCHLTDNLAYQLLSTCFAFYFPLIFMCVIYWNIFQAAKFRIRKRAFGNASRKKSSKKKKGVAKGVEAVVTEKKEEISCEGTKIEMLESNSQVPDREGSNERYLALETSQATVNTKVDLQLQFSSSTNDSNDSIHTESNQDNLNSEELSIDIDPTTTPTATLGTPKLRAFISRNKIMLNFLFRLKNREEIKKFEAHANGNGIDSEQLINNKQVPSPPSDTDSQLKASLQSNSMSAASSPPPHDPSPRSHSFKSYLNPDSRSIQQKTLKIRMPFVFSESNLLPKCPNETSPEVITVTTDTEKKAVCTPIVVETTPLTVSNKCNEYGWKEPPPVMPVRAEADINLIRKKKARIDMKRERKAAKTLGVIMSCFIICWLPFFFMQLFFAVFKDHSLTHYLIKSPLVTILLWLGYLNSLLNPVIYTIFSPDFRNAFSKILFGKYRRKKKAFYK